MARGWFGEPKRHSDAARGRKTIPAGPGLVGKRVTLSEKKVLDLIHKAGTINHTDLAINFYKSYPPSDRQIAEIDKRLLRLYVKGLIRQLNDGTWMRK